MKPKTKIQKQIIELRDKLPKTTGEHEQYALNKAHSNYVALAYKTKHDCLECGHTWKANNDTTRLKKASVCPSCNQELELLNNYKAHYNEKSYFAIITTIEDFQVVRVFMSTKYFKKGIAFTHDLNEVIQHYIDQKGDIHTISKPTQSFGYYFDAWTHGDLEFRTKSPKHELKNRLNIDVIYPKKKVTSLIKRNGFKNSTHGILPHYLFQELIKSNEIETLFKLKQYNLIQAKLNSVIDIKNYWKPIKIAIKNNYKIPSISDWKDYISLLMFFNKDVTNAKYVCPADLKKEHNKYVEKKRIFEKKRKLEELKKQIEQDNIVYQQEKQAFFSLLFKEKNLVIEPIKTVQEFFEEGTELKHCLFQSEYHKKPNSLIFSVKLNGKRVETVQFSLTDFKILQSRGYHNSKTKHTSKVKKLIHNNINAIKKIAYQDQKLAS